MNYVLIRTAQETTMKGTIRTIDVTGQRLTALTERTGAKTSVVRVLPKGVVLLGTSSDELFPGSRRTSACGAAPRNISVRGMRQRTALLTEAIEIRA